MIKRSLIPYRTYFSAIKQKTFGTGFFDDACKEFYLCRLLHCQNAYKVQIHAYLLMEKEVLLLFTPLTPSGFDSFVRFLNGSYSRYYLIRFERTVIAWQNEPLVCRLIGESLVLDCQKFIERYMLDNSIEAHPGEYGYSSYCANAFTHKLNLLKRHRVVSQFMQTEANGLRRYREFVAEPFRHEYERYLQSRLLWGLPLLSQRHSSRLENNKTLADTEESDTIARVAGYSRNC